MRRLSPPRRPTLQTSSGKPFFSDGLKKLEHRWVKINRAKRRRCWEINRHFFKIFAFFCRLSTYRTALVYTGRKVTSIARNAPDPLTWTLPRCRSSLVSHGQSKRDYRLQTRCQRPVWYRACVQVQNSSANIWFITTDWEILGSVDKALLGTVIKLFHSNAESIYSGWWAVLLLA